MMLEQELSRTLRAAAQSVPPAREDLLSAVLAGQARRRLLPRHHTLLAAGAVLAVVLLVVALVRLLPQETQLPQPGSGAVFEMPERAADGKPYRIVAMAGRARPVVAVEGQAGQVLRLDVYDAGTRAFITLDRMNGSAGCPDAVSSDGQRVYWAVTPEEPVLRIMSAPVSGGKPSVVANAPVKGRISGDCPERLQVNSGPVNSGPVNGGQVNSGQASGGPVNSGPVSGGHVTFSEPDGGVFQVPARGGVVREVPGSAGLRLESWPWASDDLVPAAAGKPTRLVNLATGETRRVKPGTGMTDLKCSVTTCAGVLPDPPGNSDGSSGPGASCASVETLTRCAPGRLAVQDLGGARVRPLERFGQLCGLVLDRFVLSSRHQTDATARKGDPLGLYPMEILVSDLRTGERTVVRDQWEAGCALPGFSAEPTPWLSWPTPKTPGKVTVLDLTAR